MFAVWKSVLPASLKYRAMVAWYNVVGGMDTKGEVLFLNHGYDDPAVERPTLPSDLEAHRYPIHLYNLVASRADLAGKEILEVSSGLGGGAHWMAKCLSPDKVTGLDIASRAVASANARFGNGILSFVAGDAQAMPFADSSFDAVINIESSLNYPDFLKFLAEVNRVLRPGGHFMFADYRSPRKFERMKAALQGLGYRTVFLEDVTEGVVRGLAHTSSAKRLAVARHVPALFRSTALRFAGLKGDVDEEHLAFSTGRKRYLAAVLQKPGKIK